MKSIILAAGPGSRLRPITLDKPKCSVTVAGKPILEHQIEAYAASPVEEVIVATGYKHEYVADLCASLEESYDIPITVVQNSIYANTDNLYSLYRVFAEHEFERFVLSNGDVIFPKEIVREKIDSSAPSTVFCDTSTFSQESMKIRVSDEGKVNRISKSISEEDAFATSIDVYQFSSEDSTEFIQQVRSTVERGSGVSEWVENQLDEYLRTNETEFTTIDIAGKAWMEIDDIQDLKTADQKFSPLEDIASKEAFFFDLDGTVYVDDTLVDGASHLLNKLNDQNKSVFYLSNNSSKKKSTYTERLASMGLLAEESDIILSTDGTLRYLESQDVSDTYVVGTQDLREEFRAHGIDPTSSEPSHVIVGFDSELTYNKVKRACLELQDGARFVQTHPDVACPSEAGFIPDAGSIGALIETTIGREPERIFGKPNVEMLEYVLQENNLNPDDIVVIGDRLETEIELANRIGCDSVCVLTGDSDRIDIELSPVTPTTILPSIAELDGLL